MKFNLQAVVARIDGEAVSIEGINDSYTHLQMIVPIEGLDDKALTYLRNKPYITENRCSFNLGKNEAKDQFLEIGNLFVSTETFQVEIADKQGIDLRGYTVKASNEVYVALIKLGYTPEHAEMLSIPYAHYVINYNDKIYGVDGSMGKTDKVAEFMDGKFLKVINNG